jgi:hypothetical protein
MAEPVHEAAPPRTEFPPTDTSEAEIAHRNMVWGWALFGLFCVLFAGTVGVAYLYLWLS